MNVYELQAKIGLDTGDYENGVKKSTQTMETLKGKFNQVVSGANKLGAALKTIASRFAGAAEPMEETSEEAITLKNKIQVLSEQYKKSEAEVKKLASAFNESVAKTGAASEESQKLAQELSNAEKESSGLKQELDKLNPTVKESSESANSFSQSWEKASNTIQTFAGKVGNIIKTIAKVGIAAVSAGAAALTALGKASIDQYAEYEQLAGGVQKIFDEMDNSQVFQDANKSWRDLNMSANEYLSTIVDVGANFAATMGDKKGYDTARKGLLAISNYASGTGKNVDELSQKFTMITRSAASYQSIADQFSGILPATSKDFLAQAQAAGYLSDSYKELTQVPIAEYQEAVALMLEKGVDALNLTGNTAAETAKTMSGSFAAVKSTWENLVRAFSDPNANLGQYLDDFIESVTLAKDNVVPRIREMLPRIVEGIGTLIDELGPEVELLIEELLPSLISGAAKLVANLIVRLPGLLADFAVALKDALVQSLDEAGMEEAGDMIETAFNWIIENKDSIVSALKFVGGALAAVFVIDKIVSFISVLSSIISVITPIGAVFAAAAAGIIANWDSISESLAHFGEGMEMLGQGFVDLWNEDILPFFQGIGDYFGEVFSSISESFNQFVEGCREIGQGFILIWEDIKNSAINAWNLIVAGATYASQTMSSVFSVAWSAITVVWSAATGFFQAIWDTIQGIFAAVESVLSGDFQAAWDAIQGILVTWSAYFQSVWDDIKSVFADAVSVGSRIVDDIKSGINSAWGGLVSWFNGLWDGLFGGRSVNVNVNKSEGSHAGGLDYVPFDGYLSTLHRGEMVLTRSEADAYRRGRTGNTSGITIIQNIQAVPQTPVELAAATESYFQQARWAI